MIDSPLDLPHFQPLRELEPITDQDAYIASRALSVRVRSSLEKSEKLKLGWLEFLESNLEISHLGEVWIQIPLNFDLTASTSDAAIFVYWVFVCCGVDSRQ